MPDTPTEIDPQKLIDSVVKSVKKSVGSVKYLKEWDLGILGRPHRYIDTGSYALNRAISGLPVTGGYPGGRVAELFGDPATGKSLLIYYALAFATNNGGYGVLDDTESCYIDLYGKRLGINNDRLIYLNSSTIEEHFLIIRRLRTELRDKLGPEPPLVIALDALAQLTTVHEVETEFTKVDLTKAKQIKKGLRLLRPEMIQDEGTIYLIANHTIANIGDIYNPTTTPGGGGVPFQSSVRVELQLRGKVKDGERVTGAESQAKVVKNKIIEPFRQCRLHVDFKTGVQREHGLFEAAKDAGVCASSGSKGWYVLPGVDAKFQSKTFYEKHTARALEMMEVEGRPPEKPAELSEQPEKVEAEKEE